MQYYIDINGQVVGPMTENQVFAYSVNPNTPVALDGVNFAPMYTYPELMQIFHAQNMSYQDPSVDSKRIACGVLAILLGGLGIHYFVMGKVAGGFITILLTIVTCGLWEIVMLVQGIMILSMSDSEFLQKYEDSPSTLPLF